MLAQQKTLTTMDRKMVVEVQQKIMLELVVVLELLHELLEVLQQLVEVLQQPVQVVEPSPKQFVQSK